ncbi:MAG: hypothetical protein K6T59_13315, partial [Bryobacteraceae bacterium]|nr:hypothetical protein [Bryobacteraceae bacterium]
MPRPCGERHISSGREALGGCTVRVARQAAAWPGPRPRFARRYNAAGLGAAWRVQAASAWHRWESAVI